MKNHFSIAKKVAAAALGLLLFAACTNPLASPPRRDNVLAEGKGLVRIGTGAGAARTAVPDSVFDHYQYLFSKDGGAPTAMTPAGSGPDKVFELDSGNWSVTVKAFVGAADNTLAAEGIEAFTVDPGEETEVTVRLSPVIGEGTGTLHYSLAYPAGAELTAFTLTLIADDTAVDLLAEASLPLDNPFTGSQSPATGYYLARARVEKDGIPVEKIEVAHIYKNMVTAFELEFIDNDFKALVVVSAADRGPGTLREALSATGAVILIDLPADSRVITLNSPLPAITRSITIEGNGATLTQSGFMPTETSQLLYINSATAEVRISRLHFKGGRVANYGGAIRSNGTLILESCVFSDNATSNITGANGGAIYIEYPAVLTVSGCTFYGNSAGTNTSSAGGAIFKTGGTTLTLTGNIFWGNIAASNSAVGQQGGSIETGGFNVADAGTAGAGLGANGWTLDPTDKTATSLPFSPVNFKPIAGGAAVAVITSKPGDYPAKDFCGADIPQTGAAAGAVQTTVPVGYILDYAPVGLGTVTLSSGSVDEDGLTRGSVTLAANPGAGKTFINWIVDGALSPESESLLALNMNDHTTVRAMFGVVHTVTNANSGSGSLREVLAVADNGDKILFPANGTITLTASLPEITKSIIIAGNGATLTQSGFTATTTSQLLYVSNAAAEVHITRLLFKGGMAANNGGAIQNVGKLTLESCVFRDNSLSSGSGKQGGAIRNSGSLTVLGCTFYNNSSAGIGIGCQGGAIYQASGSLSLTGNIFSGNTANQYTVVRVASGTVASGGYNVSDKAGGTGATASGWAFSTSPADVYLTDVTIDDSTFEPFSVSDGLPVITSFPAGFPTTYFDGTSRGTSSAPGAMPAL
jgi:hypothetical protein